MSPLSRVSPEERRRQRLFGDAGEITLLALGLRTPEETSVGAILTWGGACAKKIPCGGWPG